MPEIEDGVSRRNSAQGDSWKREGKVFLHCFFIQVAQSLCYLLTCNVSRIHGPQKLYATNFEGNQWPLRIKFFALLTSKVTNLTLCVSRYRQLVGRLAVADETK
jgi:hypothetical protein